MAVSKEELAQYVAELGLPQEQTDTLVTTLLANEKAATQFVGQRLRHSDYTKKTQELAATRQQIESQATEQITQYANQLAQAQTNISKIMADLEKEHISSATANARLRSVKTKFNLSDDDIPEVEGVAKPAGTGTNPNDKGGGIDIDAKLDAFAGNVLKALKKEMLSLPRVTVMQADIAEEHRELTGKRLSRQEMLDLLAEAEKSKTTIEDAWKSKYKVDDLRFQKRLDSEVKKKLDDAEAERKRKVSEDALAGVRRTDPAESTYRSPVLGRRYNEHQSQSQQHQQDPGRVSPPPDKSQTPPPNQNQNSGPRLSGAERAAARFLERRSNGIPLGAPDQKEK